MGNSRGLTDRRIDVLREVQAGRVSRADRGKGATAWNMVDSSGAPCETDGFALGWLDRNGYLEVSGAVVMLSAAGLAAVK